VFSWVFMAEEIDGLGDMWSGDTTADDVQILLHTFREHVSEIGVFY
jgi:hypothetical protein